MIFYTVSTVIALYLLWLLAFRTYNTDLYDRPTDERVILPNIVYVLLLFICFVPILNTFFCISFIGISLFEIYDTGNIYIKSWIFDRMKQKGKEADEE